MFYKLAAFSFRICLWPSPVMTLFFGVGIRRLPLQDGSRRQLALIDLPGIMLDHLTRLARNRRHFGIRATGFEQEHDSRLAQAVKDTFLVTQDAHIVAVELRRAARPP